MIVACDTETTGLRPHLGDRAFAFSFSFETGYNDYYRFDVNPFTREVNYPERGDVLLQLKKIFGQPDDVYVFHNALFDLAMLKSIGITVAGKIIDTMLLSKCLRSTRITHALKPLCKEILGIPEDDQDALQTDTVRARREGKKLGWKLAKDVEADYWMADKDLCKSYAMRDTERTLNLWNYFNKILQNPGNKYGPYHRVIESISVNHEMIKPVLEMNTTGISIDLDKMNELEQYYLGKADAASKKIAELGYTDFNPRSSKQKKEIFYGQLGFTPVKRRRKKPDGSSENTVSVDKKALSQWADNNPLAKTLVEMSEAQKQISGFIKPLNNGKVFDDYWLVKPSFNIFGADTTRMSCGDPNLQNITTPSSPNRKSDIDFRIREIFRPKQGHFWLMADYSQIEIVCAAYLSGERKWIDSIESGKSIHDITAHSLFSNKPDFTLNYQKYRKLAKVINFGQLYGAGPKKIAEELNIGYEEARELWKTFWASYPGLSAYNERLKSTMAQNGWVTDVFGMPYFLDENLSYKALNYVIQGTASGILKRALLNVHRRLLEPDLFGARICLAIHDELILEVPVGLDVPELYSAVKTAMQGNFHLTLGKPTPFEVEVSKTHTHWLEKEKHEG